jgi:hypothetical protein
VADEELEPQAGHCGAVHRAIVPSPHLLSRNFL